jgi:hypothetical protein
LTLVLGERILETGEPLREEQQMTVSPSGTVAPPAQNGRRPRTPPPDLPVSCATSSAWREEALTSADELEGLATWITDQGGRSANLSRSLAHVRRHIASARLAAAGQDGKTLRERLRLWRRFKSSTSGSSVERAQGHLDAAEVDLLRLAPATYVCGMMPGLEAHVNRYLPKDDPRRRRVAALAQVAEKQELNERERSTVVSAVHAANSQRRREILRVRSFRNIILAAGVLLLLVAIGVGVLGSVNPQLAPLCFAPGGTRAVCPTHQAPIAQNQSPDEVIRQTASGWDTWLVEIIGIVAATLAAAFALRKIRGTSTPYSLPVALASLKLPTGALTAFLGLLLMRGNFVPGLSALDTSAQILSWAIIFGYSQQLFTRFVDDQAHTVLSGVGGRGAAGDRTPAGT